MLNVFIKIRQIFRQFRKKIIRVWRINAAIPRLLRYNPYTGFIGRKFFYYIPFILPHDKSYYGFVHLVRPGDGLFLDVGANDGISAVGFRHIHSDYRIISIEPNPCHERSLRKLSKHLKRFEYRMIGAGNEHTQMTLYVPMYNGVPIYTAASLNKEYVQKTMYEQHLPLAHDKNIVIFECKVDIVPLDELQLHPDIIKIDTEGFDYEVLLGLKKTIGQYHPHLMIEYSEDLLKLEKGFFDALDYQLFFYRFREDRFYPLPRIDLKAGENIFCIPKTHVGQLPLG